MFKFISLTNTSFPFTVHDETGLEENKYIEVWLELYEDPAIIEKPTPLHYEPFWLTTLHLPAHDTFHWLERNNLSQLSDVQNMFDAELKRLVTKAQLQGSSANTAMDKLWETILKDYLPFCNRSQSRNCSCTNTIYISRDSIIRFLNWVLSMQAKEK